MATATYTGKLTDFAEAPFPDAEPSLTVRPKHDGFGPQGLLSTRRIPVTVASNGTFSFELTPSASVLPPQSYILRCDWLGGFGYSEWEFEARAGGGNIKDMGVIDQTGLWREAAAGVLPPLVESAVDGAIADANILTADLSSTATRTTRDRVSFDFLDATFRVFYPSVYPSVYPAGSWSAPVPRRLDVPAVNSNGKLSADVIPDKPLGVLPGLAVRSVPNGPLDLEVRDGKTYIRDAVIAAGGGAGIAVKRVVVLAVLGQSNQVSWAQPNVPFLDHDSARIWQHPYGGDGLTPAVFNLTGPGPSDGISPSLVLAREIVKNDPECVVVLVPAAVGGSGLVTDTERGKWEIDYAGPNQKLYANAVSMTSRAIALAQDRWGVTPTVLSTWIQGEADASASIARAVYEAALDALITDWRGRFPGMFLIAGIVPREPFGTRAEITLALQDTPRRMFGTAYVHGVDNGGGSRGTSDNNHYGREAVEVIGWEWFKAIPRASNNVSASPINPPLKVTATRWAGTITAAWTPPYCHVDAYEAQSSTDGAAWTPVTVVEPAATSVTFASAVPVLVRVRAVNATEPSAWTIPVPSN